MKRFLALIWLLPICIYSQSPQQIKQNAITTLQAIVTNDPAIAKTIDKTIASINNGLFKKEVPLFVDGFRVSSQFGKLVFSGEVSSAMVVFRVLDNGDLDSSFGGGDGFITNQGGGSSADGRPLVIDNQQRIIVSGGSSAISSQDMTLWRLNSNGSLDTTFNNSGFIFHNNAAGGNGLDLGIAVALDSLEKIVVVGTSAQVASTQNLDMVVWRFR